MKFKYIYIWFLCLILVNTGCRKDEPPEPVIPEVVTNEIELVSAGVYKSYVVYGKVISEGGSTVISRGICWSTGQSPDVFDNSRDSGTGSGEFNGVIDGKDLKSETTYYVRAYATNIKGTGYGEEQSFTTPCRLVNQSDPIVIECIRPVNGSENQYQDLALIWDVYAIAFLKYDVLFGTKPDPDSVIARDLTRGYCNVQGLKLNTTFYWKVIAADRNAPCQNTTSPVFSFKTVRAVNTPDVITKGVTSYGITYAVLTGELVSDGGMLIEDSGFFWGESPEPEKTGKNISKYNLLKNGPFFSVAVTDGIRPDAVFYVKAYATNALGTRYGEQVQFKIDLSHHNTIKDFEGNHYRTATIGMQEWMIDNLKSTKLNDGTPLFYYRTDTTASYTEHNPDVYGRLYNFYAVNSRKLCPTGWHVPSRDEWIKLETYLIENGYNYDGSFVGNKIAKSLSAAGLWSDYKANPGSPGLWDYPEYINKSGFSALPAGIERFYDQGLSGPTFNFSRHNYETAFWSSTGNDSNNKWSYAVLAGQVSSPFVLYNPRSALSVRCVKD